MKYQHWFLSCDKHTIVDIVEGVNNRGNWVWNIWELSVLSLQLFYKYKTVQK